MTTALFNLAPDGFNGGVQAGYNWQAGNVVYGLETDIQGSSQEDNKTCFFCGNGQLDRFQFQAASGTAPCAAASATRSARRCSMPPAVSPLAT